MATTLFQYLSDSNRMLLSRVTAKDDILEQLQSEKVELNSELAESRFESWPSGLERQLNNYILMD